MGAFTGNRRGFLQHSLSLGAALAFLPALLPAPEKIAAVNPQGNGVVGRVAAAAIHVYTEPDFQSERLEKRTRDELLPILEEFQSPGGPAHNPLWYRISEGYIHSGLIQRIDYHPPNPPVEFIPAGGMLAEVTVPFTRSFYRPRGQGFQPLYRLYFQSIHWVRDVIEDADGTFWYRLHDPKIDGEYYALCTDLRAVLPEEYAPLARDIPPEDKRIQVNVEEQTLTAFEGERVALQTTISSGVPNPADLAEGEIPTDTPKGYWRVTLKMPTRHMGDGRLTSQVDAYELPGVPWAIAFHKDGYSLHGSYWHNNFGRRMSHGCINMRNHEAMWLFRWTDPPFETSDWYVKGLGTLVQIV